MSVTYTEIIQADPLSYFLRWTSNQTPPVPFRVYKEGSLIGKFTSPDGKGQAHVMVEPGTAPFVEVLDDDCQSPAIAFPGRVTVHWQRVANAASYRLEELVSAVWTLRTTVSDTGESAYSWQSRWLEDTTTHQFRVVPVDAAGNQGSATAFTVLMVRHPNPPNVSISYNGAGPKTITISAV